MEIKKPAIAGTLESSDCQIMIRPNGGEGISIDLESDVKMMFGDSILAKYQNGSHNEKKRERYFKDYHTEIINCLFHTYLSFTPRQSGKIPA